MPHDQMVVGIDDRRPRASPWPFRPMSNPATASFPVALTVGVAYVFGMVAPMVALALAWDRRDWGVPLTGRSVTWRIGRLSRTLPLGYALSGGLLVLMGALTVALAPRRPGMANDGWQVQVSAALQHAAAVTTGSCPESRAGSRPY